MPNELKLTSFISQVRQELEQAIEAGEQEQLKFRVKELELEIQVAVTETEGGKGGFDLKVVKFGMTDEFEVGQTHTVRLKLEAQKAGASPEEYVTLQADQPESILLNRSVQA